MSIFIETENTAATPTMAQTYSLSQHIKDLFDKYMGRLEGEMPKDIYPLFLGEFEKPFLEAVLLHTRHNQSKAATMLGLSRGTLRKKLKQYGLL